MMKGSLHIFDKQPYKKRVFFSPSGCFFSPSVSKTCFTFLPFHVFELLGSILMEELMRAPATDVGTLLQFTTSEVEAEVRWRFEVLKVLRTCM